MLEKALNAVRRSRHCCCTFNLFIHRRCIEFQFAINERNCSKWHRDTAAAQSCNVHIIVAVARCCRSMSDALLVPKNFVFLFLINTLAEVLDTFNNSTLAMITTFIFRLRSMSGGCQPSRIDFCVFFCCLPICLCLFSCTMLWQWDSETERRHLMATETGSQSLLVSILDNNSHMRCARAHVRWADPTATWWWRRRQRRQPTITNDKPTKLLLNVSYIARRHQNAVRSWAEQMKLIKSDLIESRMRAHFRSVRRWWTKPNRTEPIDVIDAIANNCTSVCSHRINTHTSVSNVRLSLFSLRDVCGLRNVLWRYR